MYVTLLLSSWISSFQPKQVIVSDIVVPIILFILASVVEVLTNWF